TLRCSFFLSLRRPPRPPLFPYTTLFRSSDVRLRFRLFRRIPHAAGTLRAAGLLRARSPTEAPRTLRGRVARPGGPAPRDTEVLGRVHLPHPLRPHEPSPVPGSRDPGSPGR